jgi:hypothetical protein
LDKKMKTNGNNDNLQRLMNAKLWECVDKNGRAQAIAKATGLSPQTFYNMRDNRTFPATPTIKALKRVVPKLSLDAIYSDKEGLEWEMPKSLMVTTPSPVLAVGLSPEGIDWKGRYESLYDQFIEMQGNFNLAMEKVSHMTKTVGMFEYMLKKLDPSFQVSSNHTTMMADFDNMIAVYRQQVRDSFRIEGLEPTKVREDRLLNSSNAEAIVRELWPTRRIEMIA